MLSVWVVTKYPMLSCYRLWTQLEIDYIGKGFCLQSSTTYHRLFSLTHHSGIPMFSDIAKTENSISYLFGASCLRYVLFIIFHCWTRLHRFLLGYICCSTFSNTSCILCPPRDWLEGRTCRELVCVIEMLYRCRLYTMKVKVGVTALWKYMWVIWSCQCICTCMTVIPGPDTYLITYVHSSAILA